MTERDLLDTAERAAIAEEVASAVRHDLRNRLVAISGAAFYLRRRVKGTDLWTTDPRVPRFFDVIDEGIEESNSVLGEKMTLSHLFSRNVACVDAAACVRTAVRCARVTAEVAARVAHEIEVESGSVMVDPAELALALRCLVENAVEAAPDGAIHVTGGPAGSGDAAGFVVEVRDEGPGIEEARVEEVLRPFFTTKSSHSGLGLNIAQRIARRYRGKLAIRPAQGGALIALEIPLSPGDAPDGQAPPGR
jgi:signal transduction histidine kinase